MRVSDDMSILCWTARESSLFSFAGPLATSPAYFHLDREMRDVEPSAFSYTGTTDDEESEYSKPIVGSERSTELQSSKSSAVERVESRTLEIDFDKDIMELAKNGTFRVMRSSNFDWDPFNVWIGFRGDVLVATIEVL